MRRRFHFVNVEGKVLRDITNQVVGFLTYWQGTLPGLSEATGVTVPE